MKLFQEMMEWILQSLEAKYSCSQIRQHVFRAAKANEPRARWFEFMRFQKKYVTVFMNHGTKIVFWPRKDRQATRFKRDFPQWFSNGRVKIPHHSINGLNLPWHSDLLVSGWGTMNREAAALGIPVYGIFQGPIGAVDKALQAEGRLTLLSCVKDVRTRIKIEKRPRPNLTDTKARSALNQIVAHIESLIP